MIKDIEAIKSLNEREYYSNLAYYLKDAVFYNSKYFEWIISNMYELFDKDEDTLNTLVEKDKKLKKELPANDSLEAALTEFFHDTYSEGECAALALLIIAFISYKRESLAMEEYYELRDMLVPFNLPISLTDVNLQSLLDKIKEHKLEKIVLLSRIGKGFIAEDEISDSELVLALDELNFTEED